MNDIWAALAAPFPREAIHWRAQSVKTSGDKAMALAYIDARDVMRRLDAVVGPDGWQDSYVETPKGRIICTLSLQIADAHSMDWISKSDGAGNTDVEGDKGALSDAFKRAAVKWGIGRYLYDMPAPWVPCETHNGKWRKWTADPWQFVRTAPKPPADEEPTAKLVRDIKRIKVAENMDTLAATWGLVYGEWGKAPPDDLIAAKDQRKAELAQEAQEDAG